MPIRYKSEYQTEYRLTSYLPETDAARVREAASTSGVSISEWTRQAVLAFLGEPA